MYFKKIEIFGFKSFADKIQLEFGPGITAIVGPNGCGKTNISEAIRWVLGEQNARDMRGVKMEDIIFNGSKERKFLSMAEVSLTLDNSNDVLPVDYNEVNITRRIFRSGETEYFINKIPCRLKDIKELFMDTGVGLDTYSSIEQKKIDLILSPKSDERRLLFEEAAGIVKYKTRKNESLHKLGDVSQNLLRLGDIISEVKSRMSSLDYQARKARQYQKYEQQLKLLEKELLASNYKCLLQTKELVDEEIQKFDDNVIGLTAEIEKIDACVSDFQLQLTVKEEEVLSAQKKIFVISTDITRIEDRINNFDQKQNDLLIQKDDLYRNIQMEQAKHDELIKEIDDKSQAYEILQGNIDEQQAVLNEKQKDRAHTQEKIINISQDLEQKKSNIIHLLNNIAHIRNEQISLETEKKNIDIQHKKIKLQKDDIAKEKEANKTSIDDFLRTIENYEQDLKRKTDERDYVENEINNKKQELAFMKKKMDAFKEDMHLHSSYCRSLEELQNTFEGYPAGVQEVFKKGFPGVCGTVADLMDVPQEYEVPIELVLGNRIQNIIVDTQDTAREIISYLKSHDKGRVTLIPLDSVNSPATSYPAELSEHNILGNVLDIIKYDSRYSDVFKHLTGNVVLVKDMADAQKIAGITDFMGRVVTTDGEVIDSTKALSGGSSRRIGLVGRKKKITELKESLKKLSDTIAGLNNSIETVENEIKKKNSVVNEAGVAVENIRISLAWVHKDLEQARIQQDRLKDELQILEDENDGFQSRVVQIQSSLDNIKGAIEEHEQSSKHIHENIDSLDKSLADLQSYDESLVHEITNIRISLAGDEERKENLIYTLDRLKSRVSELTAEISSKQNNIHMIASKREDLKNSRSQEELNVKNLYKDKEDSEKNFVLVREGRQEIMNALKEKEILIHTKREALDTIKTSCYSKQSELAHIDMQQSQITEKIKDEYNTVPADIEVPDDISGHEEEIQKLKKKVQSLGPVNLIAIDEYQELEERYKFLVKQQDDLVMAQTDLHKVINKIDATTRSYFSDTFQQIRSNFRELCKQLFEGGEAELILNDPDNVLETGIEIIAQPPGKKMQKLSLLSQGERALTAIALLFSIFMVKPTPFCVLDEVDAPLDDANLLRFTSMLREFTKKSQFIIVTHNKRTMEIADALYGVTMEEFGVSKLVSVKFRTAAAGV